MWELLKVTAPQVVTERSQSRWGIFGYPSASASQHLPSQPLVLPLCNPGNPAGKFVCVPAWRRGQHLQEWSGNGKISNAPPKIAAIPQPRAWRSCVDKSGREQQQRVKCLMPSGIFPGMFEDLRLKCCSQCLPQSLYLTRLDLLAARVGWAAPSTSPLSQKKLFTGLGVDSGAKVRNGKQKGKIKHGFLLAVDVTPETVHGSFRCLQQLSQTSTSYSLDSLKYFFPFFHLGVLPQQQECPAGEHSPACSPPVPAGRAPGSSREHPWGSQPRPSPTGKLLHSPGLPGSFRMCRQQAQGCEGLPGLLRL